MCRGPRSVESQEKFHREIGLDKIGGTLPPIAEDVINKYLQDNPPRVTPRPGTENTVVSNSNSNSRRPLFGLSGLAGRIRS